MDNPFTNDLHRKIDEVYPDACNQLASIDELPSSASGLIISLLLEEACRSQHVGRITAARMAMQSLPPRWLSSNLGTAIGHVIDLNDEWEYRRLIELLKELRSDLLLYYLEYGLSSKIDAILEAATDTMDA